MLPQITINHSTPLFVKFFLAFFITLFLCLPTQTFATKITGLSLSKTESHLLITWDALSVDTLRGKQGYAIQWGENASDVHIEKPIRIYSNSHATNVRLKTFEPNVDYYLRVYAYTKDFDGNLVLSNGSQMAQWKYKSTGSIESNLSDITDPVIVAKTSTSTSTSSTDSTNTNGVIVDFGTLRVQAYDNFSDIFWSRPNKLSTSEYDGFRIEVSTASDFATLVLDAELGREETSARIKGVNPKTAYYVRGSFYKNKGSGTPFYFGTGTEKKFTTIAVIDRTVYNRASRNIKRIEKKPMYSLTLGGKKSSIQSVSTSTSSTDTPNTKTLGSTSEVSDSQKKRARITAIKGQIRKLQAEIGRLESELGIKKTTFSTVRKKTTLSKTELRKRLLERFKNRNK